MDLFETLKKNLDFEKHAFTYSKSGKEMNDIDSVYFVTRSSSNSNSNSSMNNSDNEEAYLKKLDCFLLQKDGENKQLEENEIESGLFDEGSLSCGNYRGNSSGKKLKEIISGMVSEEPDFAVFLFKKSDNLKGYIVFVMDGDKIVVKHLCLTTVLEHNREPAEDKKLHSILVDDTLEKFIENRLLDEEGGVVAAQNINTDTTAENFDTTNNFLVILRLAAVVKGEEKEHFLEFHDEVPSYQIRSLFATKTVESKKKSSKNNSRTETDAANSSGVGKLSVKETKFVKVDDIVKMSGRVETTDIDEEKCANLEFVLMKNGEPVFKGEATMSDVKSKRSKSGKTPKRNFSLEMEIEDAEDNCEAKFELMASIECKDGSKTEGDKQDVSKKLKQLLGCEGGNATAPKVNNNSNNNTINNAEPKSSNKTKSKSKNSSAGTGMENNELGVDMGIETNEPPKTSNKGVGTNNRPGPVDIETNEYDVKLEDIYKEGDVFFYVKNIYNVKGDKVEGTKKVALPGDFMKSVGIKESNFKQDKKGNYRFDPSTKPSKTSRTLLQERLRNKVFEQVTKEGGIDYNYLYEDRLSPAEKKRRDQMLFEQRKYEAKLKREEKHDEMKMLQFDKQREDQQAKRDYQRERDKMAENRKYAEMMMRMYNKEAQRRGDGKGKGDAGDKALIERMMKMMMEQRREKDAKPVVMKPGKGPEMVPVNMGAPAQPIIMQQPARSKSKSKDRKKLKKYKRLLRALKKSHKKALSKKDKGKKKKVTKRLRKLIIKEYREKEMRSKHGKRKRRHGSKASRHRRREEERRHRKKSRSKRSKDVEEKQKKKHHKRSKHKKTTAKPDNAKGEKKVKTHKKK